MGAELSTRIGCPGVCPDGVDLVGVPSFKDIEVRSGLTGVLLDSVGSCMDEDRMVPIEQSGDGTGKTLHNGYADEMFPICEYALAGAGVPRICPKRTLIQRAVQECQDLGAAFKEGK